MAAKTGVGVFGQLRETASRPLRIFAFDPLVDSFTSPIVALVPFEQLEPGPAGRLVEVIDYDAAIGDLRVPLDLDDPEVLLNQGLDPAESDRRFHQQMVYAVAMKVLTSFETGLGRPIVWSNGRRLALVPHAPVPGNAHYHPELGAVLFGIVEDEDGDEGVGTTVYTCLSYDVIGHELVHAVMTEERPLDRLDELSDELGETYAFHEGFADLVAILSRCTEKVLCARVIRMHGLHLDRHEHFFAIATQFGNALGQANVRKYPIPPPAPVAPDDGTTPAVEASLQDGAANDPGAGGPHQRGQVLASAFIDGFIQTFATENHDLVRLSGGSSRDEDPTEIHPDLVNRLADRAATLAGELLRSVIAAVDYLPPIGVDFGDFLRAFVTADRLLFGSDHFVLRAAIIQSFHRRGEMPSEVTSLSELSIAWPPTATAALLPDPNEPLLAAAQALELRRYHTVDPELARPKPGGEAAPAPQAGPSAAWTAGAVAFAQAAGAALGLDPARGVEVSRVVGSYVHDRQGDLHARVLVHLAQRDRRLDDDAGRPHGVTVISDSDGKVLHVIPPPPAGAPADEPVRPRQSRRQKDLVRDLNEMRPDP